MRCTSQPTASATTNPPVATHQEMKVTKRMPTMMAPLPFCSPGREGDAGNGLCGGSRGQRRQAEVPC